MTETSERFCQVAAPRDPRSGFNRSAADWIESQSRVIGLWLDQLIAEGDDDELVSTLHRQQAWLEMIRQRLATPDGSREVRLAR